MNAVATYEHGVRVWVKFEDSWGTVRADGESGVEVELDFDHVIVSCAREQLFETEQEPAGRLRSPEPDVCPGCGRVMTRREAIEQGACNDCSGGAYDPRDGERP